ncbi:MAG: hypothetical protein FVQ77_12375 [Cytophagales bacterium]|nr:hypothetical protein [Cytophagales bacterium]
MNEYSNIVTAIDSEFVKFLIENEEFADKIPKGAAIIFQIEGEKGFNTWHRKITLKNIEKDRPLIFVNVIKWRRRSAIENLTISEVLP